MSKSADPFRTPDSGCPPQASDLPIFQSSALGTQVSLPFRRAFQISVQGVRIRMGRSLVTLSGVALGIAFLMSTVTTQFINRAVAHERETRQQINLMESVLKTRIGAIRGKTIAVAQFGALSPQEAALLNRIRAAKPDALRIHAAPPAVGGESTPLSALPDGAAVVLLLGDAPKCPVSLAELTQGMTTRLVIDSKADRQCSPGEAGVRRELFFGQQLADQQERQARKAAADLFRTIWIVVISLAVTIIGVANALLMSVTERFREIGTMKCLGALSSFIRRLFLIESALIGLAGSVIGVLTGTLLTMVVYGFMYGFALTFGAVSYRGLAPAALGTVVTGTLLAVLAALYPARFASRMVPAAALRSTV